MARGMPSLAALLGLVAIAGYQNRDKIEEFVKGLKSSNAGGVPGGPGGEARPEQATDMLGTGYSGSPILGGLGELIERFTNAGQGERAKSWVSTGPNEPVEEGDMEKVLGPELLGELAQQTGLTREELLKRLSRTLPEAVDRLTPDGRLPQPAS